MRLDSGILSLAPSDLSRHLGCAHATTLALEAARGERERPHAGSAYERMIQEKGDAHERDYLARLEARGLEIVEIERSGSYADMAARTRSAMEAGAARHVPGDVRARPLARARRLPRARRHGRPPSARSATRRWTPSWRATRRDPRTSCSCASTARASRPCRASSPEQMHIVLGSGRRESLRPRDFDAYFARAQRSLERFVDTPPATVAVPCAACDRCPFWTRLRRAVAR